MVTGERPIAIVTGGARRVGRAICLAMAGAGCDLLFTYRDSADEARSLERDLRSSGVEATSHRLDLGDTEAVTGFGRQLAVSLPRLDALVHNASMYERTPLDELSPECAAAHYQVNALSPLLLTRSLAGLLCKSPGGAVVTMCDIHAMGRPRRDYIAYAMSKAALLEMTRSLALELAPNIRVNAVAPGVVAFPDTGEESLPEAQRRYLSRVPLDRSGEPQDAAEAVRWLALDAKYTTGQVIRVDGGRWLT